MSAASQAVSGEDWPASQQALEEARAWITRTERGPVIIACDHDVDGLASAVLVSRALERLSCTAEIVPVGRGQHIHERSYRDALASRAASFYIVTDMGSRGQPIGLPSPTLVLDHHASDAFPPDAFVVSAANRTPVVPTSYLAFELFRPLVPMEDLSWLALLGCEADLGAEASFGALPEWRARHRRNDVSEAIALLNAARRAPEHDVATALRVLAAADSPRAIAAATSADVMRLRAARAEVAREVQRWMRVPPRMFGDVAVIQIRSKAQIHPLVAMRWKARLRGTIVLVANENFLPGRVNFVVRSMCNVDLMAWLRSLSLGDVTDDFARGHPAATGGSLEHHQFEQLLTAIAAGVRE
jgi:single-stranded DNA-specific DHH superfamily exonuclease